MTNYILRKLTAAKGGPENDGPAGKPVTGPLEIWPFLISMLDFWGVVMKRWPIRRDRSPEWWSSGHLNMLGETPPRMPVSHHQKDDTFSSGSLEIFLCHSYWEGFRIPEHISVLQFTLFEEEMQRCIVFLQQKILILRSQAQTISLSSFSCFFNQNNQGQAPGED